MLPNPPLSRREMLAVLGAAGLGGLAAGCRMPFASAAPARRWGLELYTVRDLLRTDFEGTLRTVGQIGYTEVETAGYNNHSAAEIRKWLDAAGLAAPSAHVDITAVNTTLPKLLDDSATIGHKWLVVPSLPGRTADVYKRSGEQLAVAAAAAKSHGIRIGYHNHDVDFRPLGDTNGMDILLASSGPTVFAELDVYWIVKAGGDPFDFLAKHPGRVKMLHLKDASPAPELAMRSVGAGTIDWPRLLKQADQAGVEHCFVEHDNPGNQPGDAIASARASFEYLNKLQGERGRGRAA
jgi:sugar phosphate isomerase/epimerase